jgi:hypothetical protein
MNKFEENRLNDPISRSSKSKAEMYFLLNKMLLINPCFETEKQSA